MPDHFNMPKITQLILLRKFLKAGILGLGTWKPFIKILISHF